MQEPLLSILTPFKDTASYLPQCIESIQSQDYENWELIIVDDHSVDTGYAIVRQYAHKDDRIKLYTNPGNGIIEALRFAFSKSEGAYITRMDSDDVMPYHKLTEMKTQLDQHGKKHVALGLVKYFGDEGISDGYYKYEQWLNRLTQSGANYTEIYKECVIPSPCWMVHREDLIACEAFEPNRYPEDYDLAFRFYKYQYTCIPSNTVLHYWRDYSNRTSRTHEHYAQNYFLAIKTHYFLQLDYRPERPLTLWGAGFKGKEVAKLLLQHKVPFYWICNNPKKIGKKIYKQRLLPVTFLNTLEQPQSIITVANSTSQKRIKTHLKNAGMQSAKDYFFFC
ncbi:MAG TPA: glycosyltransferase family 2 protein [Flavobacteriaceae bacterium]|nr:glycosyltransferase family 2 protein [Flavobacteriaceae bacterium]